MNGWRKQINGKMKEKVIAMKKEEQRLKTEQLKSKT